MKRKRARFHFFAHPRVGEEILERKEHRAFFRAACEKMGAMEICHGDAGFQFDVLGGYRMQIMVYAGDDEFPPSSQVLYSDNFETGFAAEDRVVAGDILISAIKANL